MDSGGVHPFFLYFSADSAEKTTSFPWNDVPSAEKWGVSAEKLVFPAEKFENGCGKSVFCCRKVKTAHRPGFSFFYGGSLYSS